MHVSEAPSREWDAGLTSPLLTREFAVAAAASGHQALYIERGTARALVLVRTHPIPLIRSWTKRAQVYVTGGDAAFVRDLVPALADRGIAHARIEDTVDGLSCDTLEHAGITPVVAFRLTHSLAQSERELFVRLTPHRRIALRRARRAGITVAEIRSSMELQQYCALAGGPDRPGGPYDAAGAMPQLFIRAVFGTLTPGRQALFLLARRAERPIAGAIFLASADRMTLFHTVTASEPELAVSAWDPDLVDFQGPTAVTWHAIRAARARGIRRFDLGAVAPVARRNDPRFFVDHFKRSFGGFLEPVYHGEVTLSRLKHAFQAWLPARNVPDDLPMPLALDARKSA